METKQTPFREIGQRSITSSLLSRSSNPYEEKQNPHLQPPPPPNTHTYLFWIVFRGFIYLFIFPLELVSRF